jgi:hypothetical protein
LAIAILGWPMNGRLALEVAAPGDGKEVERVQKIT